MLLGYARVSTSQQETHLQLDALTAAGCARIFEETASGAKAERPELARLLDTARAGDVVVVWKMDRLGRSLLHLIATVNELNRRGIELRSLTENLIDTTSPSGKLVFGMFALMAEFERDLLRQRTLAGLAAAKQRGRNGGRPRRLGAADLKKARVLLSSGAYTRAEVAAELGVSRHTLWRELARGAGAELGA